VIAAQVWLSRYRARSSRDREVLFPRRWNFWLWVALFAVFLLRGFEHYRLFPINHAGHLGEMNHAVRGADYVAKGAPFSTYNVGLGLLFYPFFEQFGYRALLAKQLTILLWGGLLVAVFVLFSLLHRGVNNPLVFLPVVLFSWILPSLRTYTWHVGAAIAATAVYFLAAAILAKGPARRQVALAAVGVVLYVIALSTYHATLLFLPVLAAILAASWLAGWRADRRAGLVALLCLPLVAVATGYVVRQEEAAPLPQRLRYEIIQKTQLETPNWNLADNALRSWDNFFHAFLGHDASLVMRVLFLSGIVLCIRSFRTSVFARTSLVSFVTVYAVQWPLWGHADWSQNCYTIIPLVGILLVALRGLENTVALIPSPRIYRAVLVGLTLGISAVEYRHYFAAGLFYDRHYKQDAYDTRNQLTLALRDVQRSAEEGDRLLFMPALQGPQQGVSYRTHDLEWKNPRLVQTLENVRFFDSAHDLGERVRQAQAKTGRAARVYFGVPSAQGLSEVERYMQELPRGAQLVQEEPYRAVMHPHIRLFLTYVDVPEPLSAEPRAGPSPPPRRASL
jgi:hypothetical protein